METISFPIVNIKPHMKNLTIKAIILDIKVRISTKNYDTLICELLIADDTATCTATLFDSDIIELLKKGDILLIKGAWAKIFRGKLQVRLPSDNFFRIGEFNMVFNDKINISEACYVDRDRDENVTAVPAQDEKVIKSEENEQKVKTYSSSAKKVLRSNSSLSSENFPMKSPFARVPRKEISHRETQKREVAEQGTSFKEAMNRSPVNHSTQQRHDRKRPHSPIKAPRPEKPQGSTKLRIAHHSLKTNTLRGSSSTIASRLSLKKVFHADARSNLQRPN